MGKFLEWNKKIFNDPTPVLQFMYMDDGQGNKDIRVDFLGSKFFRQERRIETDTEDIKIIETKKVELLE